MRPPFSPIVPVAATPGDAAGAAPGDAGGAAPGRPPTGDPPAWRRPPEAPPTSGALRLDRRVVPLLHAAARWETVVPETSGEAAPRSILHLALTDRAPEGAAASSLAALFAAAAAGEIRGALATIDPETAEIVDGDILLPEDERPRAARFAGEPPQMRLIGLRLADGRAEGRIATQGMISAFHAPGEPYPATYALNATFAAPLPPAPRLTAVHDGPAARSSAPGVAAAAFLSVLGARDAAAVLDHVSATHPGRDYLAADPAQALRDLLGPASAAEMTAALTRVYEFDGSAIVLFDPLDEGSVIALRFVREGERWRLAEP